MSSQHSFPTWSREEELSPWLKLWAQCGVAGLEPSGQSYHAGAGDGAHRSVTLCVLLCPCEHQQVISLNSVLFSWYLLC